MKKLRQMLLPVALPIFLFGAGFAPPAVAQEQYREPRAVMLRDGISLDEAVSRAEQQYRARVVRTEVQDEDGRKVYVLKLLSDNGRVFTVRIDAATGRMR